MVRVWTQEEKDFLRDNYDKFPTEEVARRLGRTRASVNIKATRWKIKKPSHYWTAEDKIKLQQFYPIVNTREELCTIFPQRSYSAIEFQALKMGLRRKVQYVLPVINFSIIDTQEKAYFLGFVSADGYLLNNPDKGLYKLSIVLAEQDYEFLCMLRDFISPDSAINKYKRKDNNTQIQCYLDIWNKKLIEELQIWGLHQKKSHTLTFPYSIPKKFYWHWIRGYFDGDGCVYITKGGSLVAHLSGNVNVLTSIKEIFNSDHENRCNVYEHPKGIYRQISYSSKTAEAFLELMYQDATMYMPRKYLKYTKYKQDKGL
jgi:intein/homing endonuclease